MIHIQIYIYIYIYIYNIYTYIYIYILQIITRYNKNIIVKLLKHFTVQYPTFTLGKSFNGEMLHIYYTYLFHCFSSHKC